MPGRLLRPLRAVPALRATSPGAPGAGPRRPVRRSPSRPGSAAPTLTLLRTGHLAALPEGAQVLDLPPLFPLGGPGGRRGARGPGEVDTVAGDEVFARSVAGRGPSTRWPPTARRGAPSGRGAVAPAASQPDLAAARADIAEGVACLPVPPARARTDRECPWRGLAAYDVDDAALVCRPRAPRGGGGRADAGQAPARARGRLWLGQVLARAGGPARRPAADVLPGSAAWRRRHSGPAGTRCGADPAALGPAGRDVGDMLRRLVAGPDADDRVVLAVDQLEEPWTMCTDEGERRAVPRPAGRPRDRPARLTVVLVRQGRLPLGTGRPPTSCARSSATARCSSGPHRPPRSAAPSSAPPPRAAHPGRRARRHDRRRRRQEPGLLPLLSTALAQLWERREGRLTYPAYVGMGGLEGAIATSPRPPSPSFPTSRPPGGAAPAPDRPRRRRGGHPSRVAGELEALPGGGCSGSSRSWPGPGCSPSPSHGRGRSRGALPGVATVARLARRRRGRPRGPASAGGRRRRVGRRGPGPLAPVAGTRLASGSRSPTDGPSEVTSPERAYLGASREPSTPIGAPPRNGPPPRRVRTAGCAGSRWLGLLVAPLVAGTSPAVAAGRAGRRPSPPRPAAWPPTRSTSIPRPGAPRGAGGDPARARPGPTAPCSPCSPATAGGAPGPVDDRFLRIGGTRRAHRLPQPVTPRIRAIDPESGRVLVGSGDAGGGPGR